MDRQSDYDRPDFVANTDRTRPAVLAELESLFKAEVIIIPQHKEGITGHVDGLIRFIDTNTVLVNDMDLEDFE